MTVYGCKDFLDFVGSSRCCLKEIKYTEHASETDWIVVIFAFALPHAIFHIPEGVPTDSTQSTFRQGGLLSAKCIKLARRSVSSLRFILTHVRSSTRNDHIEMIESYRCIEEKVLKAVEDALTRMLSQRRVRCVKKAASWIATCIVGSVECLIFNSQKFLDE